MSDRRAVSSVLGVVMILGLTVAMVTSLMVIGTMALNSGQADAQLSQMENSLAQLSSKASLVALGESASYDFDLGDVGSNQISIDPDEGSMNITIDEGDGVTTIYQTDGLGAIVYENGEQSVAYQAGGVWRSHGDDGGRMISPPEFHYRHETLTLPVIKMEGDDSASGTVSGTFEKQDTVTKFPNDTLTNPVDNATVTVEIQSTYHRGWFQYLESRSDGEIEHFSENQTVRMELTIPFEEDFDGAVAVREGYDNNANGNKEPVDESDLIEGVNYPSASGVIETKIADGQDGAFSELNGSIESFEAGTTYFANESISFDNNLTFKPDEDNDIELVINGVVDFGGADPITVDGDGNVSIYARDGISFGGKGGNTDVNTDGDSSKQFRLYLHSDVSTLELSGNPTLNAVLYAPGTDVTFSGNVELTGAVIANNLYVQGAAADVSFDPSLQGSGLGFDTGANVIQFLHVTQNRVAVELD